VKKQLLMRQGNLVGFERGEEQEKIEFTEPEHRTLRRSQLQTSRRILQFGLHNNNGQEASVSKQELGKEVQVEHSGSGSGTQGSGSGSAPQEGSQEALLEGYCWPSLLIARDLVCRTSLLDAFYIAPSQPAKLIVE
jgi:hypothetical protein